MREFGASFEGENVKEDERERWGFLHGDYMYFFILCYVYMYVYAELNTRLPLPVTQSEMRR